MATLPRPYAVIRRAVTASGTELDGDAADEESDAEREAEQAALSSSPAAPKKARLSKLAATVAEEAEEDDPPLFPEMVTPKRAPRDLPPSSPPAPSSQCHGYSSDLSSPVQGMDEWGFSRRPGSEVDEDEEERQDREEERREMERKRRRANRPPRERARHYEVVAVVRKKIVFNLR